jgi:ABC-type uncharacterized transport system substrate-binding protein
VNYFTHVFVDGKDIGVGEARDFSVATENHHMVYRFLVPLNKPVDAKKSKVVIGIWDDSFFVDYQSKGSQPVAFEGKGASVCKSATFEDRDHPIFGGMVTPTASKVSC